MLPKKLYLLLILNSHSSLCMMSSQPDYYAILGISRTASQSEIRRSYLNAAKHMHPDRNTEQDATQRFQQLNTAYHILSDPMHRHNYDIYISQNSATCFLPRICNALQYLCIWLHNPI